MSLGKARNFIKQVRYDQDLRMQCNLSDSKTDLLGNLGFDEVEFEDAINMQLVNCQTYEEAETIKQLKFWFTLL